MQYCKEQKNNILAQSMCQLSIYIYIFGSFLLWHLHPKMSNAVIYH